MVWQGLFEGVEIVRFFIAISVAEVASNHLDSLVRYLPAEASNFLLYHRSIQVISLFGGCRFFAISGN